MKIKKLLPIQTAIILALLGLICAGNVAQAQTPPTYWWIGYDWTTGRGYGAYWSYGNSWASSENGSSIGSQSSVQGYVNFGGNNNPPFNGLYNNTNDLANSAMFQLYFKNDAPGAYNIYGNPLVFYSYSSADPNIQNEGTTYTPTVNMAITNANVNGTYNFLNINGNSSPAQGPLIFNGPIYNNADANNRVISVGGGTVTFNGIISTNAGGTGTLALTQLGGTVYLAATNNFNADLTVQGGGTLVLATNNAYTGNVSAGIRLGDNSSLNQAGYLNLNGGNSVGAFINARSGTGQKTIANTSTTTGAATFTGNLFLDGNATLYANTNGGNVLSGSTLDMKAQTLTLDGPGTNFITGILTNSTGSGSLVKNNTFGTATLTGTNYYTGSTTINAGSLVLGGAGLLGNGSYAGSITDNGTLAVNNTGSQTLSGAISGSGTLTKGGTGTLFLSATNTYTGGTTITSGILQANTNNVFGTGAVTMNNGSATAKIMLNGVTVTNAITVSVANPGSTQGVIQEVDTTSSTWSGPITINSNSAAGGHFFGPTTSGLLTISGPVTLGSAASQLLMRSGFVRFSGGGTYTNMGITGTASLGANNGLATMTVVDIGPSGAATLDLNGFNQTLAGVKNSAPANVEWLTNSVAATQSTLTLAVSNTAVFNGSIVGNLAVNVTGGTQVYSNSPVAGNGTFGYTGDTTVSGGTLKTAAANLLPNGAGKGNMNINSTGTLDLYGASQTVNGLSGTGTVDCSSNGTPTLTVGGNNVSSTFSGLIKNTAGSLALTKSGSGILTLSGANNTFGGGVNIGISGTGTRIGTVLAAANQALGTGLVTVGPGGNDATAELMLSNSISLNNAVLIPQRAGYLPAVENISGNNTLSGTISLTSGGSFAIAQSDAGTLTLGTAGGVAVSNNAAISTRAIILSGAGNGTVAGNIVDMTPTTNIVALTKDGAGTWTLSGANTFSGDTRITNGTLLVNNTLALQNSSVDMNAADSGTLNLNNLSATLGGLKGARNLALGTGTISVGNNGVSTNVYAGALTGGALTKVGAGQWTLSGASTHTGATTVSAGELILQTGGSISSSAMSVSAGATNGVLLAAANGQFNAAALTFAAGTTYADFNFNGFTPSTTTAPIKVNGNLTFNGTVNVIVRSSLITITNGTYPLIKYTGTLTGIPPSTPFQLPGGMVATLVNNTGNNSIDLSVTSSNLLYWAVGNAAWDILTTANWKNAAGSAVNYNDGANVVLDDSASGTTPITVSLGVGVTPASITANLTNKNYTISPSAPGGVITGSGPLIKNGTGTLTVATTNTTFAGNINVNAGTFALGNSASVGTGTLTLANGTTFLLNSAGTTFPANPIFVPSGASVNISGSGALGNGISGTISSADSTAVMNIISTVSFNAATRQFDPFLGTVTVNSGTTLRFSSTSGGDGSTNATFNVLGTLQPRNASYSWVLGALSGSGNVGPNQTASAGTSTYVVGTNNASTTFSGKFVDFGPLSATNQAIVTKVGTGTFTVSGNSAHSGATTVNVGALIGVTGGSFSNSAVTVNSGATNGVSVTAPGGKWTCTNLTYAAANTYSVFSFGANTPSTTVAPLLVQNNLTFTATPNIIINGGSTTIPVGTYPLISYINTLSGTPPATPLSLPPGVTGLITNDTVNKWIALIVTNVSTPTLLWTAGTGNWDFSSVNWTNVIAGGLTTWADTIYLAQFDDTPSGVGPFTITLATNVSPLSVLFTNNAKTYTVTGSSGITGSGAITKTGTGTLVLLTTNSNTGGISVSGGTLQGNSSTLLGNIANNASLVFDQTFTGSNNAVISGIGSVTKQNSGTVALGGSSTFTGNLNINAGTLAISAGANAGGARSSATTNAITINGGTLQATNGAATITLPSNAGITVGASGATIDVASGITLDYPAQAISGNGALTKNGTGTFQIDEGTASSTYSSLTLNAGTIAFNKSSGGLGAGSLIINGGLIRTTGTSLRSPNNPAIQVNADFTLGSPTTAAISFANGGAWTLANGNRTITVDTITATITGVVGDGGNNLGLIKAGSGSLILSSADTYTGPTTISAGSLKLANNLAAGTNSITAVGQLQIATGVIVTNPFTADQTFECMDVPDAGATGFYSGTAGNLGNGFRFSASGSGAALIFSNATVNITSSGKTFWPTRGNILYAGNTVVNNGASQSIIGRSAGNPASLTLKDNAVCYFSSFSMGYDTANNNTSVTLTIQDSAAMNLGSGSFNTLASSITGTGLINLNGGTLAAGSFTKGVTGTAMTLSWNGGTIKANAAGALFFPVLTGLTAIVSTNGGTLNDNGFNITVAQPLTHDTTLGATADGGLTKSGAGVTTLSGANTYTGPTTVNAGTVLLTGSLGTNALTVNSVLNGTGTVNGATTVNFGGTLQAGLGGADTSTLNISNALTLAGNAQFNVNRTNTQTANKVSGLTSVTYGGTLTVTNVATALVAGDTFTLFSAGSYSGGFTNFVLPTLTAGLGWNTNNLSVNGTLSVISLLGVAVSPATTNVTYGTSVTFTANVTGSGPFTYQWFDNNTNAISNATNSTLNLTSPAVAASGNYTVIVTNPSASATNSAALTVTTAALGITANNDSKTYGQAKTYGAGSTAFTPSGLQNGEIIGSVTLAASGGAATNSPVGSYTLTPSAATGGTFNSANYSITYTNGSLTVNPATLLVQADNQGRAFGTANPTLTASYLGFVNGEGIGTSDVVGAPALSTTAVTNSPVGAYVITASLGTLTSTNYSITTSNGVLNVTAAALLVQANNQSRAYGATNPVLAVSYSGFVNGDTTAVLSGSPAVTTTATTNSPVSTYAISVAAGTLTATNYSFVFSNGTLTVTTVPLGVTANNDSKTYDGTGYSGGNGVTYSGFVNGETSSVLGGSLTYGGTSQNATNAGSYTIVPAGLTTTNYAITFNNGSLTVNPLTIAVTANPQTKVYGAADPALTYGNTPALISGDSFSGALSRTTGQNVGSYAINQGTLSLSANYTLNYTGTNLVITPAALGITANSTNKAFGSTLTFAGTEFTTAGLQFSDSVTSVTLISSGAASGAAVGSYSIVPSAASGTGLGNYNITYNNGTLTVTAAATTVAVSSSENPAGYLDSLTFTANVTPTNATGSVTFFNGATPFSTNTLALGSTASSAINSILRGTNTITAIYSGDANYAPATNFFAQIVTNHPPVANNVGSYRGSSTTFKIKLANLATNATDVDGDTLTVTAFGTSTNGITLTTSGGYAFYVNTNLVNDQFTYTVSDGNGGSATANINLTARAFVTGQNGTVTVGGSSATVSFAGIPGFSYTVQRSTNLLTWVSLWSTNAPINGQFNFTDSFNDIGFTPASAYYRLSYP